MNVLWLHETWHQAQKTDAVQVGNLNPRIRC